MGLDSGGGETTPGKKMDPKSCFVSEIRSFLHFHITISKLDFCQSDKMIILGILFFQKGCNMLLRTVRGAY